ncbi:MAG TPA: hypothetical protein PK566_02710 [Pseudobacteroides sp.]|nr:hypothetical protein [Pseudobacteroides sp.]
MVKVKSVKKSKTNGSGAKRPPVAAVVISVLFVIIVAGIIVAGVLSLQNKAVNKELIDEKLTEMEGLIDQNKLEEAKKVGNEILAMKIDDESKISVYWEMAICESYQGNFGTAIDYANKISSIDVSSGHFMLGLIYTDMKRYDQAINEFTASGQTGAIYKEEADRRIEELRKLLGSTNQ